MGNPLVIITSKAHLPRMHAHRILLDHGYDRFMVVVDDIEQKVRCINEAGIPVRHLAHTSRPTDIPRQDGIAWTRQWIEEHLVPKGQWYVTLDDNVRGWTAVPEPFYTLHSSLGIDFETDPKPEQGWRKAFETPCAFETVVAYWRELIAECELHGTVAGGFAIETNFFFRGRKWQTLGYVRAQNAVWKNVGLPFYYWPGAMLEDYVRTVDVVARYGSIRNNRFVKPIKQFFEPGGIGTFEERRPNLVACCAEIQRRWPGLTKLNKGQDYSLTFALRGKKLDDWRNEYFKGTDHTIKETL